MASLKFAYYCSGHGYGHATRVSAVATYLCQMNGSPTVYIVTSAPRHVFSQAIKSGAQYRYAEIDPVIVQPLAYHVDRRKSVEVLKSFLSTKNCKTEEEVVWLRENSIDCVLSDAAFLPCIAAHTVQIPSVLITNFTFDSVYSYLSIEFPRDSPLHPSNDVRSSALVLDDEPIPPTELEPLVKELYDGYRCAELLLRLPGNIPLPSFSVKPSLPSYLWTNAESNSFYPEILASLSAKASSEYLHPPIPFPDSQGESATKLISRRVVQAPLIVRHPSADIYTPVGRKRVLDAVGVPGHFQTPDTKILVVSFGGQIFKRPQSRASSRSHSPITMQVGSLEVSRTSSAESSSSSGSVTHANTGNSSHGSLKKDREGYVYVVPPIATSSHLWVPGAPPADKTLASLSLSSSSRLEAEYDRSCNEMSVNDCTTFSSAGESAEFGRTDSESLDTEPRFLPDDSWIAIVCGVTDLSKSSKGRSGVDDDELPHNFFVAPSDIYMPDLTALGDVLLGKLGYGTTAECVDACTPFIFVPRPLFVEEHGLRRLLHDEGTGVELSRQMYEAGDWADIVQKAWMLGKDRKTQKRMVGDNGKRRRSGEKMAADLVEWVRNRKQAGILYAGGERKEMNQVI